MESTGITAVARLASGARQGHCVGWKAEGVHTVAPNFVVGTAVSDIANTITTNTNVGSVIQASVSTNGSKHNAETAAPACVSTGNFEVVAESAAPACVSTGNSTTAEIAELVTASTDD